MPWEEIADLRYINLFCLKGKNNFTSLDKSFASIVILHYANFADFNVVCIFYILHLIKNDHTGFIFGLSKIKYCEF